MAIAEPGTHEAQAGASSDDGRQISVEDKGMRRHIGRIGLLFAGVGSIIGSGWLFGALDASSSPVPRRSSPGHSAA